jgi:cysteine desulfurase/selenocysteine lyase
MKEVIYLDNAATSFPKAPGVADAVTAQLTAPSGNANRGTHTTAQQAAALLAQTRLALAKRFGSNHPHQWCFFLNATDALNAAIKGCLQPGDHAVTTHLAHTSVLRPLHGLQARQGITYTLVPVSREGFMDPQCVMSACSEKTRLIILSLVSNVAGTLQPVAPIITAAHARGIMVLIDASQAAGECPLSVEELDADMVALPCHKGLLAPQGVGALYVRPGCDLAAWREGGTGTDSENLDHPVNFPAHLEAGTHNIPGIAGLHAALSWHEAHGAAAHANHRRQLAALLTSMQNLDGCTLYGPASMEHRIGPIAFNLAGWSPTDAANVLDASFGIVVRAGLHCAPLVHADIGAPPEGTLRVSPGPFTSNSEVDAFLAAITQLLDT